MVNRRLILSALLTSTLFLAAAISRAAPLIPPPAAAPAIRDDRTREPTDQQQADALKIIRDIYKDDYAKRDPEDRRLLAGKLFDEGQKPQTDAANQYVLLREARDVAVSVGDVDRAMLASKALGDNFAIDAFETNNKTLAALRPNLKAVDYQLLALTAAEQNALDAAAKEQFDAASHAADLASTFASAAKNLQKAGEAQGLKAAIAAQSQAYDDWKAGVETLKKARNAVALADARQSVGLYVALYQNQWTEGCKLIAKGSSNDWAPVAEADLKNPSKSVDSAAVADGWWDLATKETGHRLRLLERAEFWYNLALPDAEGVAKTKIEKRLEAIALGKPAYMGGSDQATKRVLPTLLELAKLKDACRLYKNGDASQQSQIISQFTTLFNRMDAGLMDTKPSDFSARLKADIDIRKMMEENGAGALANAKPPLYNKMTEYITASKSKEDLATRMLAMEKLNADTGFMNADKPSKDRFDNLLYMSLTTYVKNNHLIYNSSTVNLALVDFLKQKGVKSAAVDRYKQSIGRTPSNGGTPPAKSGG